MAVQARERERIKGFLILLRFLSAMVIIGYLQGCGGFAGRESTPAHSEGDFARKAALYRYFGEWEGTKYRLGGMSKQGVDCSGFVYLTYYSQFGVTLPRTTRTQSRQGVAVSQGALRPGDLVFFKTGADQRHVGIFVEGRKFLHASSSRGVMLSSLDNRYWAGKYWTARRIN